MYTIGEKRGVHLLQSFFSLELHLARDFSFLKNDMCFLNSLIYYHCLVFCDDFSVKIEEEKLHFIILDI
jgi:hypothetical protein